MQIRELIGSDNISAQTLIFDILGSEFQVDRNLFINELDLKDIKKSYQNEGETFFVAEDGNKIVGTIGVKKEADDTALIRRLFVHPEYRKKGYGHTLLLKALDFCKMYGYKKVEFRGTSRMVSAIALCKRCGFHERGILNLGTVELHRLIYNLNF